MAENQEQIESQLCGYVDDTLDPAQRAEIEAHLHAHPQHRQLLAELRLMRDALRGLPRESAPTELSESFSGQLERSVLLDGIGDQPMPTRMRINRLPQLAAVAAIILLAGGLGLVVYFVILPGGKPAQPQQAQNIPSVAPAVPVPAAPGVRANSADGVADAQADRSNKSLETHAMAPTEPIGPEQSRLAAAVPAPPAGVRAGDSPFFQAPAAPLAGSLGLADAKADADPQLTSIANSVLTNEQVKALLGHAESAERGGGANRPTVVMVVSTANPDATTRQLGNYLQTNNADWQPAPSADELAQAKQVKLGNGARDRDFGIVAAAANSHVEGANAPGSPADFDMRKVVPATMPQTQPAASDFAYARAQNHNAPGANGTGLDQQAQRGGSDSKSGNPLTNAPQAQQNQLAEAQIRCYVIHNLSFQQATQISDMLRQADGNTQAPLFADRSADDSAKPGNDREFSHQAKPPAPDELGTSATTQPATQPQYEPTAEGDVIGHRSNIPGDRQKDNSVGGRPQTTPAAAPPAAASTVVPINNQTLLGSSPVDLVILIKDATPASPTTAPSTSPSTDPATQPASPTSAVRSLERP